MNSDESAERTSLPSWVDESLLGLLGIWAVFVIFTYFHGQWTNIIGVGLRGVLFIVTVYVILKIAVTFLGGLDD